MGQFLCPDPAYDFVDPKTQQPYGCTKENKATGKSQVYNKSKINSIGYGTCQLSQLKTKALWILQANYLNVNCFVCNYG